MKRPIIPFLIFCLIFPILAVRLLQTENPIDYTRESREMTLQGTDILPDNDREPSLQPVTYEELSTKQINYLIP